MQENEQLNGKNDIKTDGNSEKHADAVIECGQGEAGAGEALSGPIEELAPEALTPNKRRDTVKGKPPNVLVYCGKKDSTRQFDSVKATFQQCLNSDKYVIYQLKHDIIHTSPWAENTTLLIIASEKVYDGVDQAFLKYFQKGGMVISFGSVFDGLFVERIKTDGPPASIMRLAYKHWKDVAVICTKFQYGPPHSLIPDVTLRPLAVDPRTKNPIIVEAVQDLTGGVAILSQVCTFHIMTSSQ